MEKEGESGSNLELENIKMQYVYVQFSVINVFIVCFKNKAIAFKIRILKKLNKEIRGFNVNPVEILQGERRLCLFLDSQIVYPRN